MIESSWKTMNRLSTRQRVVAYTPFRMYQSSAAGCGHQREEGKVPELQTAAVAVCIRTIMLLPVFPLEVSLKEQVANHQEETGYNEPF